MAWRQDTFNAPFGSGETRELADCADAAVAVVQSRVSGGAPNTQRSFTRCASLTSPTSSAAATAPKQSKQARRVESNQATQASKQAQIARESRVGVVNSGCDDVGRLLASLLYVTRRKTHGSASVWEAFSGSVGGTRFDLARLLSACVVLANCRDNTLGGAVCVMGSCRVKEACRGSCARAA